MAVDKKEKINNKEKEQPENVCPVESVVGGKLSDSTSGKTCHQCRQRTIFFAAVCSNQKENKPCTIRFCHKCLMNRYGEKAGEVSKVEDWQCPKCRGICNCSICMKKRGQQPTGMLARAAKATGFSSVSEMLQIKGPENCSPEKIAKDMSVLPKKLATPKKEPSGVSPKKRGKENSFDGNSELDLHPLPLAPNPDEKKPKKVKREEFNDRNSDHGVADITLPHGTELTTIAGVDLPPQDVGHALQFLEFCAAFGEILHLSKGQSESILKDIVRGRSGRGGKYSSTVQFHIQLLSLIQKDFGKESPPSSPSNDKNSWLRDLKDCISNSGCALKEFSLDRFDVGGDTYDSLESSIKLRLINFLCDEVLSTVGMRVWIDDQNSKFDEKLKEEAKGKVHAAKNKKKSFKQKLQEKMAEAIIAKNGADLTISEQEAIFSQLKSEEGQAHAKMLESKESVPKGPPNDSEHAPRKVYVERCDAVRTEPLILGVDGRVCWKLKSYSDNSDILLQDMGTWEAVGMFEKWFSFDDEQKKMIENIITSSRQLK